MLLDLKQLLSQCGISVLGVIHVGAHHGQELPLYCRLGAREMALFEPLAANFQRLSITVDLIRQRPDPPRIDCYPLALGTVHAVKEMTVASNEGQSSSLLRPKEHLKNHPQVLFNSSEMVLVTRMDRIVTQPQRYNLLCIDVQGYELEVLKGGGKSILDCIDAICCEVNRSEVYEGNALVEEIDDYLSGHGFERISTVWAGGIWGDAFYCRRNLPTQKRAAAQKSFVEHSNLLAEFCSLHGANHALASGQESIKGGSLHVKDSCKLISFNQDGPAADLSSLSALRLARMGRFSNNIIQLLHSTMLARKLGLGTIVLPSNFAHFKSVKLAINGMAFVQGGMSGSNSGLQLVSSCWFPYGALQSLFESITIGDVNRLLDSQVKPLFFQHLPFAITPLAAPDRQPATRIALHIRSGDLFAGESQLDSPPHPYYVQPPLDFYRYSLKHALSLSPDPVTIQLVVEDYRNPVVGGMIQWLQSRSISYQLVHGSFLEAVQLMLAADVLISSYGSVVEMIGMLSNSLHTVYSFQSYGRRAEKEHFGHGRYECLGRPKDLYELMPESTYIQSGDWRGTDEQRDLMLRCTVSPEVLKRCSLVQADDLALPFFNV